MILTRKIHIFWLSTTLLSVHLYYCFSRFRSFVSIETASAQTYDYVIVGAGTTGCVLANRLSAQTNLSILLIEAGSLFGVLSKVPLLATFLQKTSHDWQYTTTQQRFSSKGFVGQKQNLPRGKGLGGSGQLNYLLHFDGAQGDFDEWRKYGLEMPFGDLAHAKHDEANGECASNAESCFVNVPLPITPIPYDDSRLMMAFADSVDRLKSMDRDLVFSPAKYNTLRGYRFNAYDAFLKPALGRENLHTLINTRVHKILFDGKRLHSIQVSPDSKIKTTTGIRIRNELILCAGAINTPQILMLSGIGPKGHLKQRKIPLTQNARNIGKNLYDHLSVPLFVALSDAVSITRNTVLSLTEFYKYLVHGEGVFSNFGVLGYVTTAIGPHSVGVFGVGAIDENVLRDVANYDQETFRATFPYYSNGSQEGLVLLNACNQPASRGRVSLTSARPDDKMRVNPSYLQSSDDVSCTIRAIRLAVRIVSSEPFRKMGATIAWPRFSNCQNFGPFREDFVTNRPSDSYLECVIRTSGTTAHHPGGTCAIGTHHDSPLDGEFRVRGVDGVRVVDASVLPTPVSGTPNSVLIRVADHAADVILGDTNTEIN